mmetsp:Transcript_75337/g.174650  ORF Transcript_75337/g.174650 Transcript_75337/m.174650 type:complete len:251 (+) Transcript_75337:776-1528(+)
MSSMMARTMLSMVSTTMSKNDQIHMPDVMKYSSDNRSHSNSFSMVILKHVLREACNVENSSIRRPKRRLPLITYARNVGTNTMKKWKRSVVAAFSVFATMAKRGCASKAKKNRNITTRLYQAMPMRYHEDCHTMASCAALCSSVEARDMASDGHWTTARLACSLRLTPSMCHSVKKKPPTSTQPPTTISHSMMPEAFISSRRNSPRATACMLCLNSAKLVPMSMANKRQSAITLRLDGQPSRESASNRNL